MCIRFACHICVSSQALSSVAALSVGDRTMYRQNQLTLTLEKCISTRNALIFPPTWKVTPGGFLTYDVHLCGEKKLDEAYHSTEFTPPLLLDPSISGELYEHHD